MKTNWKKANKCTNHKCINYKTIFSYALVLLCSCALLCLTGCDSGNEIKQLKVKIDNLEQEKTQLSGQIQQSNSINEQLISRIQVLQNLPDGVKGDNLYQLENVKIHNYSGLFDENEDGTIDTLIVRLQPLDNYGDLIKAAGTVEIELWDLAQPDGKALIGQWKVLHDELKEKWNELLVTNYRLAFDISDKIDKFEKPLTISMTFTDHLSGKVFQKQKVIEP